MGVLQFPFFLLTAYLFSIFTYVLYIVQRLHKQLMANIIYLFIFYTISDF